MQIHVERGESAQALRLFETLRERLQIDLGVKPEQETLEINEAIRSGGLRASGSGSTLRSRPELTAHEAERPDLLGKPSIAVLPFENMSVDPEQSYFADGIAEDIITDLSRVGRLFVIARNSSFAYRGRAIDVKAIGQELGVRYIVEGSVRKAANRVRITGQLIDTATGAHLWAARFDGEIENVFSLQDEVTAKIVEALLGRLTMPLPRARPKNMEAYELCIRTRNVLELSSQAAREGMLMLQRAVMLDPDYAEAHAWLAHTHWLSWMHWGQPMVPHRQLALDTAEKAVVLDPNDACCRWILANILACERRWEDSDRELSIALNLDPNHADAWALLSDLSVLSGRIDEGLNQILKAFRFNPYPPNWYFLLLGQAQYAAREYALAIETLRREETYRTSSRRFLAANLAQLGQLDEARREVVARRLVANRL
jgi:TolB-like protein